METNKINGDHIFRGQIIGLAPFAIEMIQKYVNERNFRGKADSISHLMERFEVPITTVLDMAKASSKIREALSDLSAQPGLPDIEELLAQYCRKRFTMDLWQKVYTSDIRYFYLQEHLRTWAPDSQKDELEVALRRLANRGTVSWEWVLRTCFPDARSKRAMMKLLESEEQQ